jgi:hypothetical protein
MINKRNSNLTEKDRPDIDTLFRVEDGGIYDWEIDGLISNKFSISPTIAQLEVIVTPNFCIQIARSMSNELIRYRKNGTWTEWEKCLALESNGVLSNDSVKGYDRNTMLNELQLYVNKIRKDQARPLYMGKQPLYDDQPLRKAIEKMVPTSREPEIVPSYKLEQDIITMKNLDWVKFDRIDSGESSGVAATGEISYIFDNNYDNRYKIMSEEGSHFIIGDPKYDRIFIEGHFRPFAEQARFAEHIPAKRSANFMVLSDLDWKWAYNGGRIHEVNVAGNPVSELYYKCTPDLGYGWPQSGSTGTQTFKWNPASTVVTTTHPISGDSGGRVFGTSPNIEHVLWR